MTSHSKDGDGRISKRPPAKTPEGRERQMVNLAIDVAEQQMMDGTASAAVITHYLKIASVREEKERLKLDLENRLLQAKTEQIGSQARSEEMYKEAIEAFKTYSGQEETYDD